jgi:hypothetical protein
MCFPRQHKTNSVFTRLGVLSIVVADVDKPNTRLFVDKDSGARHPVFGHATDKKIPAGELVTGELPLIALQRTDIEAPNTDTRVIPPSRTTSISYCGVPFETTFGDRRERDHVHIPSHAIGGSKKNALMAFRRKKVRNK